jgi:hypothetical protein
MSSANSTCRAGEQTAPTPSGNANPAASAGDARGRQPWPRKDPRVRFLERIPNRVILSHAPNAHLEVADHLELNGLQGLNSPDRRGRSA